MNAPGDKGFGRLAAAERFYGLKLKEAQLAQADAERALALEDDKRRSIALEVEALELYRRDLSAQSAVLDVARLDQALRYVGWVAARLDDQLAALERARRECDAKLDQTRGRFEEIAALQRACDRRAALLDFERTRAAQKLLDAHAAMKLARTLRNDDTQ